MKFPNAAKGVKKIFTAVVLMLIVLLSVFVSCVLALIGLSASTQETAIGDFAVNACMILCVAALVLVIVAFIMNLVGVINASRDESSFKSALIFIIITMVLSIVSGFLKDASTVAESILSLISSLASVFVLIFIIAGIIRLADRFNRGDIGVKGSRVLKLLVIIKVVALIITTVAAFMGGFSNIISDFVSSITAPAGGGSSPSVALGVLFIAVQVLEVVQYIIYLPFLSQAKKMLNKA